MRKIAFITLIMIGCFQELQSFAKGSEALNDSVGIPRVNSVKTSSVVKDQPSKFRTAINKSFLFGRNLCIAAGAIAILHNVFLGDRLEKFIGETPTDIVETLGRIGMVCIGVDYSFKHFFKASSDLKATNSSKISKTHFSKFRKIVSKGLWFCKDLCIAVGALAFLSHGFFQPQVKDFMGEKADLVLDHLATMGILVTVVDYSIGHLSKAFSHLRKRK
jgi:hypothetical protein